MAKPNRGGKQHSGSNGISAQSEKSILAINGHDAEVEQVLNVRRYFAEEYSPALNPVLVVSDERINGGSMSDYLGFMNWDENKIAVRREYFDTDTMNKEYDEDIGFHPTRGDKPAIEAVVAHEFGHYLTHLIARAQTPGDDSYFVNYKTTAREIVKRARAPEKRIWDADNFVFKSRISGYAKESDSEAIAEAVADVYCNGKQAKKESQRVVKEIKRLMSERI